MNIEWKERAEVLYFGEGEKINAISKQLGISERSISAHLNSLPNITAEKERRKQANRDRQRDRDRERKQRSRLSKGQEKIDEIYEFIKLDHRTAVRILSRDFMKGGRLIH